MLDLLQTLTDILIDPVFQAMFTFFSVLLALPGVSLEILIQGILNAFV
jgi:hypothetical protein